MVVNVNTNEPRSVADSSIRTIVSYVLAVVPVIGPFIEVLGVVLTKDGRRLGDYAAGTQVIATRDYDTPPTISDLPTKAIAANNTRGEQHRRLTSRTGARLC